MKIDYLKINSRFKNLNDVYIEFDEDHLMTVFVGWNGSGKSNVLEALVVIFRNLDLGEPPEFAYEVKYRLGIKDSVRTIIVEADPSWGTTVSKQYKVKEVLNVEGLFEESSWKPVAISKVKRDKKGRTDFLPRYFFAYYSGPSDRLEQYFVKHRTDFYNKLLKNKLKLEGEIRPLFYAKPEHSQFVLMAFFLNEENSDEREFLEEYLGIEGLDAIHFILRKPKWTKSKNKEELFWGATGVVRDFLDRLFPHTLAPIKITRKESEGLTGKKIDNEFFHLLLPDLESLRKVAGNLKPDEFFKMLESTLLSEIISEVRIRVKVKGVDQALSFRELSEGEQQLLTVLGLLKFTGGEDSLFLLDEPDTHLNPKWAVSYLSFLQRFVPEQDNSHLIMVTHNPLAIAELEKGQVQIMWKDSVSQVDATVPLDDPRGMGYAGILTSDMFGLGSSLDEYTTNLIRKRRYFLENDPLTENDKTHIERLNKEIDPLGFNFAHWDEDYRKYLIERKNIKDKLFEEKPIASPDLMKERKARTQEIIRQILEEENLDSKGK